MPFSERGEPLASNRIRVSFSIFFQYSMQGPSQNKVVSSKFIDIKISKNSDKAFPCFAPPTCLARGMEEEKKGGVNMEEQEEEERFVCCVCEKETRQANGSPDMCVSCFMEEHCI